MPGLPCQMRKSFIDKYTGSRKPNLISGYEPCKLLLVCLRPYGFTYSNHEQEAPYTCRTKKKHERGNKTAGNTRGMHARVHVRIIACTDGTEIKTNH